MSFMRRDINKSNEWFSEKLCRRKWGDKTERVKKQNVKGSVCKSVPLNQLCVHVCVYAHMCTVCTCACMYLKNDSGNSLVVQWLGRCAPTAGDMSSIPGWELKKGTQDHSHGTRTQLPQCCWLIDLHSLFVNILLGHAAVIRTETKDLNGLSSLMTQKETLRENPLRWISQPK